MESKIFKKTVGEVDIFELTGELVDPYASRVNKIVMESFSQDQIDCLLFNTRDLSGIDSQGAESLLSSAQLARRCAVISRKHEVNSLLHRMDVKGRLCILEDEIHAAYFFRHEFAIRQDIEIPAMERRRFLRLETVLPLRLRSVLDNGHELSLFAIVTNLSEGGFFAKFIESISEKNLREHLHPYDLRLLSLDLHLTEKDFISLKGKMVHEDPQGMGIGVEFYEIEDRQHQHISDYLMRQRLRRNKF